MSAAVAKLLCAQLMGHEPAVEIMPGPSIYARLSWHMLQQQTSKCSQLFVLCACTVSNCPSYCNCVVVMIKTEHIGCIMGLTHPCNTPQAATWRKPEITLKLLQLGFSVLHTDLDVRWLADPMPWLARHAKHADLLLSSDQVTSTNAVGDDGPEASSAWTPINTGVLFARASAGEDEARVHAASCLSSILAVLSDVVKVGLCCQVLVERWKDFATLQLVCRITAAVEPLIRCRMYSGAGCSIMKHADLHV